MMNSRKIKILIPIFGFGKAGGYRVLSKLANSWIDKGHNIEFVAHKESDIPYYPTQARIIWINDFGKNSSNNYKKNKNKSMIRRLLALFIYVMMNQKKYDVILANYYLTALTIIFAKKSKCFYYIQAYEPEFYEQKGIKFKILKFVAKMTYFLPLRKIVNAKIYLNYKNLKSKIVVPPGLDLKIYNPKNYSYNKDRELIVGCIGRIEKWKGSEDVKEAVKILHKKGYNVKFKVAFNPVDYDEYELIKPDGDANLAEFYRSLDILVAPGHIQLGAIHYPVIEAMACKTTVITTGYYPASDLNAYIVPVKRPDIIADSILEIMRDPDIASIKSEEAYRDVQQFDWDIVSQKFIDLF